MWFDDDLIGGKGRFFKQKNASRRRPVLVLNTRLRKPQRREWLPRLGIAIFAVAVLAASVVVGGVAVRRLGRALFVDNSEYTLTNILVAVTDADGAEDVGLRQFVEDRALTFACAGTNLFKIDIVGLQEDLAGKANIERAHVLRCLPHTLEVVVVSRTPVAALGHKWDKRKKLVVDSYGVVFFERSSSKLAQLPEVVGYGKAFRFPGDQLGERLADALTVLKVYQKSKAAGVARIRRVHIHAGGGHRADLDLSTGCTVRLRWFPDDKQSRARDHGDLTLRFKILYETLMTARRAGITLSEVPLTKEDINTNTSTILPGTDRRN